MFPQTQTEKMLKEIRKNIQEHTAYKFENGKIKFTVFHETSFLHFKPETMLLSFSDILSCYKNPSREFVELWKAKGGEPLTIISKGGLKYD